MLTRVDIDASVDTNLIKVYISSIEADGELWKKWNKMLNPDLPVVFTTDIEQSNVIFVVNYPEYRDVDYVNKNKSKTIFIKMEPDCQYIDDENGYLAVFTLKNSMTNIEWFFPINYSEIVKDILPENKINSNAVSAVMTSKYYFPGHKKRIDFLKFLEENHPEIELHIYGRDNVFNFKNYKGPLVDDDKSTALIPYKYHFNCENNFIDNYITEKFTDAILCETFNFYGGPSNVVDIYNPNAYELLNMDDFEGCAVKIIDAINANKWGLHLNDMRRVKKDILENKSLSPSIIQCLNRKGWLKPVQPVDF